MAIGSCVPSVRVGQIAGPLVVLVFLLFAGNLVSLDSLPPTLRWLQYVSPVGYVNKALSVNEFSGLVFDCPDANIGLCYRYSLELTAHRNGEQVLSQFHFDEFPIWQCVLFSVLILFPILAIGFAAFAKTSTTKLKLK